MAGYKMHRGGDAWRLEVTLGTDFTGKRQRYIKTVHCNSPREADRELAKFYAECEEGFVSSSTPATVSALCDLYVEEHVKRYFKKNSQISTISHFENWVKPYLGKRRINTIKKLDIKQWVNMLVDSGKSPKTVRNIYSDLKKMFEFAVMDAELIASNPCKDIRLPEVTKTESRSYDLDQVKTIISAFDSVPDEELPLKCFVLLALFGGFRKGEILGFDWSDVDFDNKQITVRQTRYRGESGEGIFLDTPKSKKSNRTVSLPGFIFTELKRLDLQQKKDRLRFGQYYINDPAMLRMEDGTPLNPSKPYKWFEALCKSIDVPTYGIHALRHTHASLLQSLGANYVDVSERLGHSQVSTTLRIYTHLFEKKEEVFSDKLEAFANSI